MHYTTQCSLRLFHLNPPSIKIQPIGPVLSATLSLCNSMVQNTVALALILDARYPGSSVAVYRQQFHGCLHYRVDGLDSCANTYLLGRIGDRILPLPRRPESKQGPFSWAFSMCSQTFYLNRLNIAMMKATTCKVQFTQATHKWTGIQWTWRRVCIHLEFYCGSPGNSVSRAA
jgi:hypothetical protein